MTRENGAHADSFAEQNPDPILELDLKGNVVYVNPAGRAAFPDLERLPEGLRLDAVVSAMARAEAGAAPETTEVDWAGRLYRRSACLSPDGRSIRVYINDVTGVRQALSRREAILGAVSYGAKEVLGSSDPQQALEHILQRLGQATEISRIYAFENSGEGADLRIHPRAEWTGPGIAPQESSAELDGAAYSEAGFERWRRILQEGGMVMGHVDQLPKSERPLLRAQDIESILVVPVFAGRTWWGFIGFDACHEPREWRPDELDALRVVADTLGLALERRQIEASLRESEARYRVIFERGNDAIFVHSADEDPLESRFRDVNDVACRILGYHRDELLQLTTGDLLYERPDRQLDTAALGPHEGIMLERTLKTREGEPVPVEINARVVDLAGERMVVSIARDIRDRRAAETALARSQAQLRQAQKMDAVGRLAGGVAHDFNNLLTGIKGTAEILLDEMDPASEMNPDVRDILSAADRAAALTSQLLSFSRRHLIEPVDVDLGKALRDMQRMLQRLIGERIELSVHEAPDLMGVRMGNGQVEQVLVNLVINARDAMPEGGSLRLGAENVRVEEGDDSGMEPGRYVRISVRDTGIGMDEETLQRVFEPFFTTKQAGRGTGLGLSTVYGIVQQAGGTIHAESRPGMGTTFRITLPAIDLANDEAAETGSGLGHADSGAGEHILLVEDEAAVSVLVERVLERAGYEVVTVGTGEEAVERGDAGFDLVITDVVLPGLSGQEVVASLRERWPELGVIFMSGYSEEEVNRHGVEAPEHFIQKPFSPRDLLLTVRRVLDDAPATHEASR